MRYYKVYSLNIHHLVAISFNYLRYTLKPQSNGPLYSYTVISTLAVDGRTVTFGTAWKGFRPVPYLLYQMLQPTHQRPVYELYIIRYGAIITCAY